MSSKRERPNSFAGLLNLAKPTLATTEAPVASAQEVERAIGVTPDMPSSVPTEVLTDEHTYDNTAVLAPILRDRKKRERLLSWTVRLPESLKSRLERASKKYDIEMSAIVVAGTRDYLDRYFPE
jgi:hypothetical protein